VVRSILQASVELTSLRLRGFKCFSDSDTFDIAPLTLLFGKNNSGKSSVLQSLLLLRQSFDSAEPEPRLSLRGPLYSAGTYPDIVFNHRAKTPLQFDLSLGAGRSRTGFHWSFTSDEPRAPRLSSFGMSIRGIAIEIKRGRGAGGSFELLIDHSKISTGRDVFSMNRLFPIFYPQRKGKLEILDSAMIWIMRLRRMISGIRAVGPYRRPPIRRYEFEGKPPASPDLLGEYVADSLIDDNTRRGKHGELLANVNRWLMPLAQIRALPVRRIANNGRIYEIRFRDLNTGHWANLADVGSGIGQALPILVEGLRTERGRIFLVQEPETHLHPDAQLAMADFLIWLSSAGRTVIVETHSENILLRTRKAILEKNNFKPGVIYTEKHGKLGSKVVMLTMDSLAQPENWPRGFMEDANVARFELLQAMAAKAAGKK
jgi:AAA domain, putative AbiEii toxin, Type IV TA system